MNKFVLRAKKAVKKLVALSVGAAMLGASMGGAVAAADLSTLHSKGTILNSAGGFDAYVVVGATAKPDDVIGAIDVAAAFSQKAQGGAGTAGTGSAVLSVQTFKGGQKDAQMLQNQTSSLEVGYGAAANTDAVANYTYEVNSSLNWTTVQNVTITEAAVLKDISVNIASGKVTMEISVLKDTGAGLGSIVNATLIQGGYMQLFGTNYYIVNFTNGQNITIGSAQKHADLPLTTTLTDVISTDDGATISVQSATSEKVILKIIDEDGTNSGIKELSEGESLSYGGTTVVVDEVLGTSYVTLTIVSSQVTIKDRDKYPDSNWEIRVLNGMLRFTSQSAINLATESDYYSGVGGEFRVDYVQLSHGTHGAECIINITEGQTITRTLSYSAGTGKWTFDGAYPGATMYNATQAKYAADLWSKMSLSGTDYGTITDGSMFKLEEVKGDYFTINLTYVSSQNIYSNSPRGLEYTNTSDTLSLGSGDYAAPFYASLSGVNVTGIGADNVAFKMVGTQINVIADLSDQISGSDTNALNGTFWLRKDVDGVFQSGKIVKPLCYGMWADYDANLGDADASASNVDKLTFTEPGQATANIEIAFNDSAQGMLFRDVTAAIMDSNAACSEPCVHNTTFGTKVYYNLTGLGNSYYDGATNGNITFVMPKKQATYGVGSYIFSDEKTVAAGATGTFGSTTVKVSSVTGIDINYITPGIGRLSDDALLTTPAKPLILVGGPAANPLVATAGLTEDDFKVEGAWWSGHALIKLYETVADLNDQTVLVIAGVDAADTVWASRLVAKELLNDMVSPLTLIGTEVWIGTSVTSVDEITTVEKPAETTTEEETTEETI